MKSTRSARTCRTPGARPSRSSGSAAPYSSAIPGPAWSNSTTENPGRSAHASGASRKRPPYRRPLLTMTLPACVSYAVQPQADGREPIARQFAQCLQRRMRRGPASASTAPTDDARRGHRTRRRTSARTAATPRRRMPVQAIAGVSGRMPAPPPRRAVQTAVQARAPARSPNRAGSRPAAPAIPAVRSRLRQSCRRRRRQPPSMRRRTPPRAPAPRACPGRVRLCQFDTDAVRHQDIEHAPQQVARRSPATGLNTTIIAQRASGVQTNRTQTRSCHSATHSVAVR